MAKQFCVKTLILCLCVFFVCTAFAGQNCTDSDNDGICDERDACPGTPKGISVNERGCWIIANILFDFDKSVISPKYYPGLDEVVRVLKENPGMSAEIRGHASAGGTAEYNQRLSERRAEAVMKYFEDKGIDSARLRRKGYGFSRPASANGTPEGRRKNSRVELRLW